MKPSGRTKLIDVAREAGVSVATVDRFLSGRAGVRAPTAERVSSAIKILGYKPDPIAVALSRRIAWKVVCLLPEGANSFMQLLGEQVRRTAEMANDKRISVELRLVDVFEPARLVRALDDIEADVDGVAVVALDHPAVREAIDRLVARGVKVVTLVSDVPRSLRHRFVGIDNPAAGRTAGALMGRFLGGRKGKVALVAGSLALRDHAERVFGFRQVLLGEFPGLEILDAVEGRDDRERNRTLVAALLARHGDLIGLYNVGAGTKGVVDALEGAGKSGDVVFVGHELTPYSRRALSEGRIAAVINQDPGHEVRSCLRILSALFGDEPLIDDQERIRIDIFIRENLP